MRDAEYKIRYLVGLSFFVAVSLLVGCAFSTEPALTPLEVSGEGAPVTAGNSHLTGSTESLVVKAVCELICQGEFNAASELIEQTDQDAQPRSGCLDGLAQIVREYKGISQRREEARRAAYAEKLAELEKFRMAPFCEKVAKREPRPSEERDEPDVNDVNDVNDISKVLSTIAQVCEFADEQQKEKLLSEPFVKQVFQKAIDKAVEFESKGKWLDAYITCYSWLGAIDKENKTYSDYAEQLAEKAGIVASFQDSPCETRKERFQGVEKQMFIRAIDALQFNYVSIIDYHQMATSGLRRCELLAEVMNSSPVARLPLRLSSQDEAAGRSLPESRPLEGRDESRLAAWSVALAAILDEINQSPTGISKDKFIDVFEKVLVLNTTTVEFPTGVLIAQFSEAALSALDPYTVMVWPSQLAGFEKEMTKEFTGIGILLSREKRLLTVESLLPDTPAYNSGLDAGDVIEKVDGVPTKDMSLGCAVKNITGPAGSKVTLTIRRLGEEEPRDITITRAKIIVPPIRGWQRTERGRWLYMIDDRSKIGYVRITDFDSRTAFDLEKVLSELEAAGLKGLILDLRFNSGGLLSSAVEVADKFIEEGPIVITRPRSWVSSTYASARKENAHLNYPLVILINRFSASASEIVAGALADKLHSRAILVGERTHGKGSVQGITTYPGGGAQLKYTMAYYHLPSGQRVESQKAMKRCGRSDWGVGPNIEVKLRNNELRKMSEVQRDNDVLVKADHDRGAAPLKKHTVEETLAADPQLAVGVLVIKSKLIQASSIVASLN